MSIPDACCDPSAAEINSRALGPVQTLYESLNRFISLGGNDHNSRLQTGLGREIRVTSRCEYHRGRNMKESESRGRNNSFIFKTGDHAASGKQQINPNGLLNLRIQSVRRIPLTSTQ